ncbi:hypothetical protein Bca52824_052826 [Brassica carinata]|uniref:Uncharacterized protein n=1 Tax=Brassica carinata TaxID=52824 RepID=A0A8X7R4J4_BRACI|nr:hypothetical protein Bca52824_052826 [Brassica carinata]
MDLAQRLLVSEAREQFRDDDDGQEAVDILTVPISYYPGNIFAEESPLEAWRIRPSVADGQDWPNVEKTKSTVESVEAILRDLNAHGVSFIIPKKDKRPWSPPRGYQCVYESYFQNDTKLWFPIPRIVTAYAFRRGVALSQLMNGSLRLMVILSVIAAEAGTSLSVRSFEELTSVSISDDGLVSMRMLQLQRGSPSNRSAFEEPPRSSYRVLWNAEMVGHPNLATYPEDWKKSARTVALQRHDHWENFTRERIQKSIDRIANQDWISDSLPHINQSTMKRLSLFTRAEQKEINRAKSMKQLPDLSLIVAGKIGAKKSASGSKVGPPGTEVAAAAPVAAEQALTGGSSQRKNSRKKKKDVEARGEPNEEGNVEQTGAGGTSKKGGKKRKAGDPPTEDALKKKKMKKKDFTLPRPSSVCEEELQVLVPEAVSEVRTSDDDEDETIALRLRRRERRTVDEGSRGAFADDRDISETPRKSAVSEGWRGRLLDESPARIAEGSETRVSGRPKETPEDGFKFEFDRGLPLTFHPEDCGRLLQLIKGGPDQLPPVKDLIFKDEYEHAACSSVKEKADLEKVRTAESLKHTEEMNRLRKSRKYEVTHERIRVMIAMIAKAEKRFHRISLREDQRDKYDNARCLQAFGTRKCLEQIRDSGIEIPYLAADQSIRVNVDLIDSEAAIALRTPHVDRDPRSEDRMKELAQTAGSSTQRTDQDIDPTKQTSAGAVIPKDGVVPTIVLTDSPAKASKNASSSSSSSEDPEKEDGVPAGRPKEVPTANADPPAPTFGRVSGPREGGGSKDPPVVDE